MGNASGRESRLSDRITIVPDDRPDVKPRPAARWVARWLLREPPKGAKYFVSVMHLPRDAHGRVVVPDVEHQWVYKNTVGMATPDRERAMAWIIDALLAGHFVARVWGRRHDGFGYQLKK